MSGSDEEPYSTIFASLKHPIRRRILRMLSKKPMSFMEMIEVLGVSNSFLTYHLENLGELIGKTEDGKYKLSSFGEAANATMTKVEDIPASAARQSSETKRVVGRSVAMALAMMCIVLVAGIGGAIIYYTSVANDKDKTISSQNSQISSLGNQKNQLQTWLDGNETLLNQTQANNTYLQNQIDSLNSKVTNLQNQANNFQIGSTDNSTIWVNNRIVNATEGERVPHFVAADWQIVTGGQLIHEEGLANNKTYANASVGYWAIHVPSAGYVSIRVSSNNTSTYVGLGTFYPLNDTLFNSLNDNSTDLYVLIHNIGVTHPTNNMFIAPTYDEFSVGFGGTAVFPVLPTWIGILVGSYIEDATATVTITYYY
jgi:hypothetical protein